MKIHALALLLLAAPAAAQQVPDTTFDTRVAHPAYAANGPNVLFDEAHHNFHTTTGRYRVFADLLRHDGYRVTPNARPFTSTMLAGSNVLVIANALGAEAMDSPAASNDAFTPEECDAVQAWVYSGGALFLIADHVPMGAAARTLAARFNVGMRSGYTIDPVYGDPDNPTFVVFTARHGLAADDPIVLGRDSTERVRKVVAFTGQSLSGPSTSVPLLALSERAEDLIVPFGAPLDHVAPEQRRSAAGRAQALELRFGRGRVIVAGEAAMFSAQLAGPHQFQMGMNQPGIDNRQFTLNVMHWLSGLLDPPATAAHAGVAAGAGAAASAAPHASAAPAAIAPLAIMPPDSGANATHAVLLHLEEPAYPPDARRRGISGTVYVQAFVRADSVVTDVRLLAGIEPARDVDRPYARKCDAAAVGAVWRSRFAPATANGKPVDSWITVPVTFRLD